MAYMNDRIGDMTFGTPAELAAELAAMKKGKKQIEEMSQFDRELVGADRNKHVVVPMGGGIYSFRRIAALLNQLAGELEMLSRRTNISPREAVLYAQEHINETNRELRRLVGKGQSMKDQEKRYNSDGD